MGEAAGPSGSGARAPDEGVEAGSTARAVGWYRLAGTDERKWWDGQQWLDDAPATPVGPGRVSRSPSDYIGPGVLLLVLAGVAYAIGVVATVTSGVSLALLLTGAALGTAGSSLLLIGVIFKGVRLALDDRDRS